MFGEFENTHIDGENDNCENFQDAEESEEEKISTKKLKGTLGRKDIIQLKINFILRGLIPLEIFFDQKHLYYEMRTRNNSRFYLS